MFDLMLKYIKTTIVNLVITYAIFLFSCAIYLCNIYCIYYFVSYIKVSYFVSYFILPDVDKTRHLFLRSTNKKTLSIYRSLCTIVIRVEMRGVA